MKYTFDFVFRDRDIEYALTSDPSIFRKHSGPRLNYSSENIDDSAQIIPSPILFDEGTHVYGIDKGEFCEEECLAINGKMDPPGAIFYVLSRMEEYNSKILDKHGRFPASNSVLYRFKWLDRAVCDRWAEAVIRFVGMHDIEIRRIRPAFRMVPTFDIDNTYAYKLKGGLRHWLAISKDILKGRAQRILEREQVIYGGQKDPYDTYDQILELTTKGFEPVLFWLLGDFTKFDRNVSYKNKKHRMLIQKLSKEVQIGIHPSYKSNSYEFFLNHEKERLEDITGKEVDHSRQHFLKVHLPYTLQHLETAEIRHEYSMGYPDHYGFRSGTARPHLWFDLEFNRVSKLTLHPFAYMDGTLHDYMKMKPEEAKDIILRLVKEVKTFGGDFVFIWHNETIGGYGKWAGWKEVFEYTLSLNEHE
jgi:hypothetical protein